MTRRPASRAEGPPPSWAFADAFRASLARRAGLLRNGPVTAVRLLDGGGDGLPGVYVDRYGPAAVLAVYDDSGWDDERITRAAHDILDVEGPAGLASVYVKRFSRDRSRMGGQAPPECTSPAPRAGVPQPETIVVREYDARFEVRPYDGFSTGLFLEHREHRRALPAHRPARALNLFAYTCGFSVPLAAAGAQVTNVDVSARYLAWGQRNHALNGVDPARVRYRRMDSFTYLAYAARHADERYDLVLLDPPTFGAGDRRRGVAPWKATADFPRLLAAAARVLTPRGLLFAATNSRDLARDGALRRMVRGALGPLEWLPLPPWPDDVREDGRVAAVLVRPR